MVFENYASTFLGVNFRQNNKNLKNKAIFLSQYSLFLKKQITKFGKNNLKTFHHSNFSLVALFELGF
jgi:hypothetical protein